jgi:ubiquinone/menaquinone biosynthesis C-methylase UbiE
MALFRTLPTRDALVTSMVGVALGDRLLQVGCGDGRLFAALAAKVGLTGRACAVDRSAAAVNRGRQAAARAGVLAEIAEASSDTIPHEADAFDVVVLHDALAPLGAAARAASLREVARVVRPGGRVVVVETIPRGLARWLRRRPPADPTYAAEGGAVGALCAAGFVAVRLLSEREGYRFVEGVKPRTTA